MRGEGRRLDARLGAVHPGVVVVARPEAARQRQAPASPSPARRRRAPERTPSSAMSPRPRSARVAPAAPARAASSAPPSARANVVVPTPVAVHRAALERRVVGPDRGDGVRTARRDDRARPRRSPARSPPRSATSRTPDANVQPVGAPGRRGLGAVEGPRGRVDVGRRLHGACPAERVHRPRDVVASTRGPRSPTPSAPRRSSQRTLVAVVAVRSVASTAAPPST